MRPKLYVRGSGMKNLDDLSCDKFSFLHKSAFLDVVETLFEWYTRYIKLLVDC